MSRIDKTTNDLLDAFVDLATKPNIKDIFSYKSRTTKRLLRRVIRLAQKVSEGDQVQKDAIYVEVWFACIAPIWQGYWLSRAPEDKKKQVLDAFLRTMLNIIFNDVFMPIDERIPSDAFDHYYQKAIDDLSQSIHNRIDEYMQAMNAFFDRKGPGLLPAELIETLMHNLFDAPESPKKNCAEYDHANPQRFMEIMTSVALPMISAFTECMKG